MRARRTFLAAAFGASLVCTAVGGATGIAHADSTTFVNPDYVGAETVVQGEVVTQPPVVEAETVVAPDEVARGATLPITGGDVAGLTAGGLAMLGTGAVLVRRTRRRA